MARCLAPGRGGSGRAYGGAPVRIVRGGTVIHETTISQPKRFKDDAREVQEGFECGILLEGYNDVKEGDVLEVYTLRRAAAAPTPLATARSVRSTGRTSRRRRAPPR